MLGGLAGHRAGVAWIPDPPAAGSQPWGAKPADAEQPSLPPWATEGYLLPYAKDGQRKS